MAQKAERDMNIKVSGLEVSATLAAFFAFGLFGLKWVDFIPSETGETFRGAEVDLDSDHAEHDDELEDP